MAKRALIVGCNYPGTDATLRGCVNDAHTMQSLLTKHFGFSPGDITMMLDTDAATTKPTGANIKAKLRELVAASRSGDVLFFHFSGHGTQVPDDGDEVDRKDEAICPTDMNVICDDDLRAIFSPLAPGVKLTVVADCCHSGSLLDHAEVAISGPKAGEAVPNLDLGGLLVGLMGGREVDAGSRDIKNRALPTNKFLELLSAQLGAPVAPGNIRDAMTKVFGNAASLKATNYVALAQQGMAALKAAQAGNYTGCMPFLQSLFAACSGKPAAPAAPAAGGDGGAALAPGEPQLNVTHTPEAGGAGAGAGQQPQRLANDVGILITGCQAHETSADACPSGNPREAYGALTNALNSVLTAHFQQSPGTPISYRTTVASVRDALGKARFSQNPCLECSQGNADSPFLLP